MMHFGNGDKPNITRPTDRTTALSTSDQPRPPTTAARLNPSLHVQPETSLQRLRNGFTNFT